MASISAIALVALVMMMIMLISAPTITFAKDIFVGDEVGWTTDFNYTAWAETKQFYVGDTLVFIYFLGIHNVYKVNGTDYKRCKVPVQSQPFNSGNDTIALSTQGKKWYICGKPNHCLRGQKLAITVFPNPFAPPAASPAPRLLTPWLAPTAIDYETIAN